MTGAIQPMPARDGDVLEACNAELPRRSSGAMRTWGYCSCAPEGSSPRERPSAAF
jgi:hypothetical protein